MILSDYQVIWFGNTGVIRHARGNVFWETISYLHCTEAEARQVAEDLGTELRYGSGVAYVSVDCPNDCIHAAYWK